jgi:hypothetical protein
LLLVLGGTVVPFPTSVLAAHLGGPDERTAAKVVVLQHGSGGATSNIDVWSRELNELGISTFDAPHTPHLGASTHFTRDWSLFEPADAQKGTANRVSPQGDPLEFPSADSAVMSGGLDPIRKRLAAIL